MGNDDVILE